MYQNLICVKLRSRDLEYLIFIRLSSTVRLRRPVEEARFLDFGGVARTLRARFRSKTEVFPLVFRLVLKALSTEGRLELWW